MNKNISNAIKINFDAVGNPEAPTLILAKRNGDRLGKINAHSIELVDNLNAAPELSFTVYKYLDNEKDKLWDLITNFKLVYCVEWNVYFEANVEVDEGNETVKTVMCTRLGDAELSQIVLYNIQINTDGEDGDIARDDYVMPTVLYRKDGYDVTEADKKFYKEIKKEELKLPFEDYKDVSLLHRILKDKAPHYSIAHVDDSIRHEQRTFTFDGTSIYDACQEIAEEIGCLFVFDSCDDGFGNIKRTISVYDLQMSCLNPKCGYRNDSFDVCPKCNGIGKDENDNEIKYGIKDGFGNDTTIFVTADELAEDIQFTTEVDAVKNCFKLEAGDEYMTDTIRSCNPNGSDYIWYLSEDMKSDMSEDLVGALEKYDEKCNLYQGFYKDDNGNIVNVDLLSAFNKDESLTKDERNNLIAMYNKLTGENEMSSVSIWRYNDLVDKYNSMMNIPEDEQFEKLPASFESFSSLINALYNVFDMREYLKSGLMPTIDIALPSMDTEYAKLNSDNLSPVAVNVTSTFKNPLQAASVSTVDGLVLSMAKVIIDSRYKVEIYGNSTLSAYQEGKTRTWKGKLKLSVRADEEVEPKITDLIEIEVNDDYETYAKNKLDKILSNRDDEVEDMSISSLFKKDLAFDFKTKDGKYFKDSDGKSFVIGSNNEESFQYALKQYSLNRLKSFRDACNECLGAMQEMNISSSESWSSKRKCNACGNVAKTNSECPECGYNEKEFIGKCPKCDYVGKSVNTCTKQSCGSDNIDYSLDIYTQLYVQYYEKLGAIDAEIAVRDAEIAFVDALYDNDKSIKEDGVASLIQKIKSGIQEELDFEKCLGEELWLEFCSFRREDKYSNDNYISDGKTNVEIIELANKFIETAKDDIFKSSEKQHSISANLKNLLVIKKFKPLVDYFRVGNWLRVMVDDQLYKLRLINYTIDYENLDSISVEFSDVVKANSSVKSIQGVLSQVSSMATSYPAVQRQASKSEKTEEVINDWFDSGLDATNVKILGGANGQSQTWDSNGMLFREYDDETGEYSSEQMKIVNSTLAITTDNWQTTKTAVGKYLYTDKDGNSKIGYGINAETIIGKLILGETIDLSNDAGTLTFDNSGLTVKNDINSVLINPDNPSIFNIKNKDSNILSFNNEGNLIITGDIVASSFELIEGATANFQSGKVSGLADVAISGSYNDLEDAPSLSRVATSGNYADLSGTPALSTVAISGNYNDLSNKPTIPTVPNTSSSVTSNGDTPVSGSAVYNYAVAKNQGASNAGKLLYVNTDGSVTTLSINELKTLLGL